MSIKNPEILNEMSYWVLEIWLFLFLLYEPVFLRQTARSLWVPGH